MGGNLSKLIVIPDSGKVCKSKANKFSLVYSIMTGFIKAAE